MAGSHQQHGVQASDPYQPGEMGVDEVDARRSAPVAEQARLDVLGAERLAEQRVLVQVDLSDGQVIGRAPPGIDGAHLVGIREFGHSTFLFNGRRQMG